MQRSGLRLVCDLAALHFPLLIVIDGISLVNRHIET